MAITIHLNINVDLSKIKNLNRFQKKNQPALLAAAAARYVKYLRNRFIRNARGGGQWEKLSEKTIKRKEQRGIADHPEWILRESDTLLDSIGTKVTDGITYVGIVHDRRHPRNIRLFRLARIHTVGNVHLPARPVVAYPNDSTRKRMVEDIMTQYNKYMRANRSKK